MAQQGLSSLFIALIRKPCLARSLKLTNIGDGSVTIDEKIYWEIDEVESLLKSVKRKDLSAKGKMY